METWRIAVVGGGTTGNGIAHVCAVADIRVRLVDVSSQVLDRALATIGRNLDRQVKKGVLDPDGRAAALARIETATEVTGSVADADLVIEAIPERVELKRELFAALDRAAPPAAIAKLTAGEAAMWVTDEAIQVFSGYGYMREYPVEKLMRDAKGTEIFEGTSEILRVGIARTLMRDHQ